MWWWLLVPHDNKTLAVMSKEILKPPHQTYTEKITSSGRWIVGGGTL
jgi:hypothetical protein